MQQVAAATEQNSIHFSPAVVLLYGANRALRPPFMDMSASSQEAMAYEEAAEAGEMQLHTTFMFVITASCSLVLIFYFMSGVCNGVFEFFLHMFACECAHICVCICACLYLCLWRKVKYTVSVCA